MKKRTYVIQSKEQIQRLNAFLEAQPLEPLIEVIVNDHKKDRSLVQNSLMWRWITVIADELGWTKEEVHIDFKRRLLVPIYTRDDLEYAKMIQAVKKVYTEGLKKESILLAAQIVKLTSTTKTNVKQFTEYLKDIEKDMMGKGIALPHREDVLYFEAMGIKPK